jgi:hypothetical protein
MKEWVKEHGGGEYIRMLVERDMAERGYSPKLVA